MPKFKDKPRRSETNEKSKYPFPETRRRHPNDALQNAKMELVNSVTRVYTLDHIHKSLVGAVKKDKKLGFGERKSKDYMAKQKLKQLQSQEMDLRRIMDKIRCLSAQKR